MPPASARALLTGVVDYAGLFPPAGLAMDAAVAEYAAARLGADAWLLGRLVCPATRLADLARVLHASPAPGLQVSALVRDRSAEDEASVTRFNATSGVHGGRVDSIESKPADEHGIDWLAEAFTAMAEVYVEIAPGPSMGPLIARVGARGLRAKVRTGGVTLDAFPSPSALTAFLATVVGHGVPFKATAGLHHAVRGRHRLTYEDDSPSAPMYGYLNVLLAVAALHQGRPPAVADAILQASDSSTLTFTEDAVRWGDETFPLSVLRATRARHLASFGSCSFREPAGELHALTAATRTHS